MTVPKTYVDGLLVDWGAALFNQGSVVAGKSAKGSTGVFGKRKASAPAGGTLRQGGPGAVRQSANRIRSKLGSIARRAPEVTVKITRGTPKGMRQIRKHFEYISRKGEIPIEDQEGNVILGRDGLEALGDDWAHEGILIQDDPGKFREAFHIVLSMPEGTDELGVKRAARDFAAKEFEGFQYAMAMHTLDTDPDPKPSKHPHVHLAVKARGPDGRRLNPRKADLQRWREGFAEALRENGLDAAATTRLQRLQPIRSEKQAVRQIRGSGRDLREIGKARRDPARAAKAKATEGRVIEQHRELYKALALSEDAADRQLARQVAERWTGKQVREGLPRGGESDRVNPRDAPERER